ncbi:MAG: SMC-Scp complex subunit ScpB [Clostridia bacterium]|nr:SMC-Scp complex subunit ScpB [Clostridia bacterium]MBR4467585.1 SMC-Scp complex subunit ScpB [Clostridia bacterium]
MIPSETIASLQAVLFACGGPVDQERLRELLGIDSEQLKEAAEELRSMLESSKSGIQLITVERAYQLCTKSFVSETVKKALEMRKVPPLSKASLEVLAIVAYNQPVTRSFIETVRGVDSSSIVSSLCDKGLLAERGFLDAPGRPILFGTTDVFLRCFGLESIKDLPEADLSELPEQMTISEETEAVPVSEDADGPSESADGEGAESVS